MCLFIGPSKTETTVNKYFCIVSAPNGASILQHITTPSFVSVFVEPVPGATSWVVEYRNIQTNESAETIRIPGDTVSNTTYVGM